MTNIINKLKDRAVFRLKAFGGQVPRRLYDELDYINDHGGAEALLLLSDLVRHLKSKGIYVGPGYGYAPCSLLCYGLGITDIDPVRWGLPFERFTRSFKQENSFTIETSEGGFEKAMAFLNERCDYPVHLNPGNNLVIDIVFLDDPQFFNLHLGINCNTNLDIIKLLSKERTVKPSKIELDEKALKFFRDGETRDIRGYSNPDHIQILMQFQPECFSDIYLLDALYRPETAAIIPEVTRRKNEYDIPSTGIAEVDSVLMESYGFLVYQEQAILIEKILMRAEDSEATAKVREMLDVPIKNLYPKGHAIARTMQVVEMAYYKARIPKQYAEIQKSERIRKILVARTDRQNKIIREKLQSMNQSNNQL